ncbi:MAG TPA: transglycosylase family protein [Solirubrobacteraceae bacterium]|nr:transglycosylase family protein [Solirubrobacteraceae bacterium]
MTESRRRHRWRKAAAAVAASACAIPAITGSATGDSVTQLQDKLGSTQSQLNRNSQRERSLAGRVAELNGQVSAMSSQLLLVESREAGARARLDGYETKLAAARAAVIREQLHLERVRHILGRARVALGAELRGQYEQPQESIVSVLVDAKGMQQLLDTLQYQSAVKHQEQSVITAARIARRQAIATEARLRQLQQSDASAASAEQTQTNALAGMNALLSSEQSALSDEHAAQSTALAASQAHGAQLQTAVATIQKQEQAAEAAARTIAESETSSGGGSGLGATAGWAIPYKIVLCESGGQNLPPNSAGASGYYQILPSTWHEYGGSGAAAYQAAKSEQDAVASRIWNGGAGASNWSCSAITGIT